MNKNNSTRSFIIHFIPQRVCLLLGLIVLIGSAGIRADATAPCNVGSGGSSTECGVNSGASDDLSTALGHFARASANSSTALGQGADATAINSIALGTSSDARAADAITLGTNAQVHSKGSTSVGFAAGLNNFSLVTDSPSAIAIGNFSTIRPASPGAIAIGGNSDSADLFGADALGKSAIAIGDEAMTSANGAIAIGGDLNGDGVGAFAGNVNAIAIGADVIASAANTVTMGYPLFIKDKNTANATRNLLRLSNKGPAGFRFEDNGSGDAWIFRQTTDGGFTMDALNTVGQQEVKFSEGGNVRINGTLTQGSSRANKKNIQSIDTHNVLEQLTALPIHQWTYKHEAQDVKHMGPMAEDFYQTFKLGTTSKGISSLDASGIAMAAIQALSLKLDEKDQRIAKLESQLRRVDELKDEISVIKKQLAQLDLLKQPFAQMAVVNKNATISLAQ